MPETFSPLANIGQRIPDGGRSSHRQSAISGVGIHHNAGVNAFSEAYNPAREVSANYWIANDGTIIPHVSEDRRAWTSGSAGYPAGAQSDHRNITFEVSNSPEGVRAGTWAISAAARRALAMLIGDIYRRYGLGPVTRGGGRGVGIHQDWVPTACPGPYIVGNLAAIIAEAEAFRTASTTPLPAEKRDEHMARLLNLKQTDGTTLNGTLFFDGGPGVGIKGISSWDHYKLLERFIADRTGDAMYPAELAIVQSYLAPGAPTLTAATVEAAVTKAIAAAGGSVEATQVAAAVEAVLKDDFAAIPAKLADTLLKGTK